MKAAMIGLMIFGLYLIGFGCYIIFEALASTNWDQVEGKIISTKTPASISMAGSTTQRHVVYRVEVTYEYEVNGNTYESSYFSLGNGDTVKGGFNTRLEAREWLVSSDYRAGKKVTVYVKPHSPQQTVLSPGINIGTIAPIFIGLLFFAAGYFSLKYIVLGFYIKTNNQ